ncbi:MAG TPA: lytic transglycosylase domain-containing protein [Solirubrobacteraceae bacterium]|jgi:soluble lytic murein transglycosylase-like protein|nr:lytic transglycosylase domain-containing protein [Solirubrobacteraceae bacterium]
MITDAADRVAAIQQMLTGPVAPAATPAASATAATATAGGTGSISFQQALGRATAAATPPAVSPAAVGGAEAPYGAQIEQAAADQGVDPALLRSLVAHESGFDPDARSAAGALGLTQLMPSTAASLGVTDPLDPQQSLEGGAAYLRQQLDAFGGDPALALAAYNAGPGAVQAAGGVPDYPETQAYVASVLDDAGTGDDL